MKIALPNNYELSIYLNKLEKRTGACSKIVSEDDKHILLWDFDNCELKQIELELTIIQKLYNLPEIYIISSSPMKYHAYCFCSRPFMEIIHILSATPKLDEHYFRLGIVRGYFTLRVSTRNNIPFSLVRKLESKNPNETGFYDITISEYLTSNKGQFNNVSI